ncbi:hypothetical protein AGR4C_Cc100061 [Agrobacterium tumefaciens str. Kerr 14]|uniref:Uncharacterized protein n=1 Tax=Agrobacterium tumefaciens str. Kerr 14 TaxID=1183424 RepID=A0A1S7NL83_AGRTU|nr:hypothetical protein AGR4C_Cc100061 [Agrobacterium tumefaciens str. Kerr 14]
MLFVQARGFDQRRIIGGVLEGPHAGTNASSAVATAEYEVAAANFLAVARLLWEAAHVFIFRLGLAVLLGLVVRALHWLVGLGGNGDIVKLFGTWSVHGVSPLVVASLVCWLQEAI